MVDEPHPPTGDWTGYYTQLSTRGRQDLFLKFADGRLTGAGTDPVGLFKIRGGYELQSGRAWWTKTYPGSHDVSYEGQIAPDGIKGRWTIGSFDRGTFHIWPVGMGEEAAECVEESVDQPVGVPPGPRPQ